MAGLMTRIPARCIAFVACSALAVSALSFFAPLLALGQDPRQGTVRGLLVGIDYYDPALKLERLTGATNDAVQMAKTLSEVTGAPLENFIVLTTAGDQPVTKGRIINALNELKNKSSENDIVFIMFSAHGRNVAGHPYLLPSNVELGLDEVIKATAFAVSEINRLASQIKNRALVVCYDMCRNEPLISVAQAEDIRTRDPQSGTQDASIYLPTRSERVIPPMGGEASTQLGGQLTFYACGPNQVSREWGIKKRGFFSYFFEEALRAEADQEGILRLGYVIDYTKLKVSEEVAKLSGGGQQTPWPAMDPEQVREVVLATGRPKGNAGKRTTPVDPDSSRAFDAFFQSGIEFFNNKQYESAEKMFDKAFTASKKTSAIAAFWVGRSLVFQDKRTKAQPWFEESVRLDPKLGMPYNNIGVAYEDRGDNEKAVEAYKKCIELEPKWPMAYLNLGNYYKDVKRDFAAAEQWYRKAMEVDPTYAPAHANLAWLFIDLSSDGDSQLVEKAREEFLVGRKLDPKASDSYRGIAYILESEEKFADAEIELITGIEQTNDATLRLVLARFYDDNGMKDEDAINDLYRKAAEVEPTPTILQTVAWHFMETGDYTQATKYATQGLAIDDRAELYNVLGAVARQQKEFAESERLFKKAKELDPGQRAYCRNLAVLYRYDLNDPEKAEAEYLALVELPKATSGDIADAVDFIRGRPDGEIRARQICKRTFDSGMTDYFYLETYGELLATARDWTQLRKVADRYKDSMALSLYSEIRYYLEDDVAIECLKQGIAADPNERSHYEDLVELQSPADARATCDLAGRNNPKEVWPQLLKAQVLLGEENYTEAEKIALTVLEKGDVRSREVLDLLFDVYVQQYPGEDDDSVRKFQTKILAAYDIGIRRWPSDWELHEWRGLLLLGLNRNSEAESAFNQAVKLMKPDEYSADSFVQAALLAIKRNDEARVDALARDYESLGGNKAEFYVSVSGELQLEKAEDLREALKWAARSLDTDSEYEPAYWAAMNCYLAQLNIAEIERCIARANENGLDTQSWRTELATELDWKDEDCKKASIKLFESEFAAFPDSAEARLKYGLKLEEEGELSDAKLHYEQARLSETMLTEVEATIGTARIAAQQGNADLAEQLFRKATKAHKSPISLLIYASYLLEAKENVERAEGVLLELLSLLQDKRVAREIDWYQASPIVRGEVSRWRSKLPADKLSKIAGSVENLDRWMKPSDYTDGEGGSSETPLWRRMDFAGLIRGQNDH